MFYSEKQKQQILSLPLDEQLSWKLAQVTGAAGHYAEVTRRNLATGCSADDLARWRDSVRSVLAPQVELVAHELRAYLQMCAAEHPSVQQDCKAILGLATLQNGYSDEQAAAAELQLACPRFKTVRLEVRRLLEARAASANIEPSLDGMRTPESRTETARAGPRATKETRSADARRAKEARAMTVARLIRELNDLKPEMLEDESEYKRLRDQYPDFLMFKIAEQRPRLKTKILAIQGSTRHIRLAQELAAAHHGRQPATIQDDWKHHKPAEFKRLR